ncbi:hypothetical protein Pla123a_36770 [Posidoniimonas polymericola]|uniref:DUF4235 domain-containing protein n=1 Tax=Posidoniimonas polymericola TaxID=2528002 RepID=A0A5C5YG03_9BACT|nr:DUF4235 domain-containing protein [Posidoniimonas polymericola]TWT73783.1 hypothetical protein Pla123a_36770 [Posidoniimonas polymericola]
MEDLLDLQKIPKHLAELVTDAEPDPDAASESVYVTVAALGGALLTRRLLEGYWRRHRGSAPPENPASHQVGWGEALAWGVAVGAAVGLSKVLSRRGMTSVVKRLRA